MYYRLLIFCFTLANVVNYFNMTNFFSEFFYLGYYRFKKYFFCGNYDEAKKHYTCNQKLNTTHAFHVISVKE